MGSAPAGRLRRRWSLRRAAARPVSPGAARTRGSSSSSPDSGYVPVGRLDRQAVLDPRLEPAVEVVRLEAGSRERLGGQCGPAARAAVEHDRPLAVELLGSLAQLVQLDVERVSDVAGVTLVVLAH